MLQLLLTPVALGANKQCTPYIGHIIWATMRENLTLLAVNKKGADKIADPQSDQRLCCSNHGKYEIETGFIHSSKHPAKNDFLEAHFKH